MVSLIWYRVRTDRRLAAVLDRSVVKQVAYIVRRSSVHNIIKQDLRLKCLKKKAAQELPVANQQARLERRRQLLRKYPPHAVNFIWFSDEKPFTVAAHRICRMTEFKFSHQWRKKTWMQLACYIQDQPSANRWWFRWQCPVLVLCSCTSWNQG